MLFSVCAFPMCFPMSIFDVVFRLRVPIWCFRYVVVCFFPMCFYICFSYVVFLCGVSMFFVCNVRFPMCVSDVVVVVIFPMSVSDVVFLCFFFCMLFSDFLLLIWFSYVFLVCVCPVFFPDVVC